MSNFEGAMDNARQFTETLCQIIESLEAEIAELRAGQGRWPKRADDFPCRTSTTPRVITADELREGQLICIHRGHSWGLRAIGIFVGLEGDLVTIKAGGGKTFTESTKFHTIVLLEGVPEPETVTAETIWVSEPGSTWEDRHGAAWEWTGEGMAYHSQFGDLGEEALTEYVVQQSGPFTRSTAAPRGDYSTTPRLTVHALNAAPVGSTAIKSPGSIFAPIRKVNSGKWATVGDELMNTRTEWSAEDVIEHGWADATLHLGGARLP